MTRSLHPFIDSGHKQAGEAFSGGVRTCDCADRPVQVRVGGGIAHNHACGCTKCWKPEGAAFSLAAVAPANSVTVLENGNKLEIADPAALIQRHACKACSVHMHGPVEREHAFQGLSFIHPERFGSEDWSDPGFAAFVSSIIESGVQPEEMGGIRSALEECGLPPYDCLSPALMDFVATWTAKKSGALA